MEKLVVNVPAMYGDHHTIEVRRIMSELPGIEIVYASSYLKIVEVTFDPSLITEDDIRASLDEAGYLQELSFAREAETAPYGRDSGDTFFRHTVAYAQTSKAVSFAQEIPQRPLIPCPGMTPSPKMED